MHTKSIIIKNAQIVNEGITFAGDVLIEGQYIKQRSELPAKEIIDKSKLFVPTDAFEQGKKQLGIYLINRFFLTFSG